MKHLTSILHYSLLQKEINYQFIERIVEENKYYLHLNKYMNNGYTPLQYSCVLHNLSLVKLFVEYGSDINFCTEEGDTSLHLCCQDNWEEGISYLVSHGAEQNILNHSNLLPISPPIFHIIYFVKAFNIIFFFY